MRASIQVNDAIRMNVLIDDIHSAVVLEDLKRRSQVRGARHSGLEASFFRIGGLPIGEILLLLGSCLETIGDLAVWRIDNHVRALKARVGLVLSHPDATEVSCGALGPAAGGGEHNRQNQTAPNVFDSRRRENEFRHALPRYSRIQSTRCLWADAAEKRAESKAGNTP